MIIFMERLGRIYLLLWLKTGRVRFGKLECKMYADFGEKPKDHSFVLPPSLCSLFFIFYKISICKLQSRYLHKSALKKKEWKKLILLAHWIHKWFINKFIRIFFYGFQGTVYGNPVHWNSFCILARSSNCFLQGFLCRFDKDETSLIVFLLSSYAKRFGVCICVCVCVCPFSVEKELHIHALWNVKR